MKMKMFEFYATVDRGLEDLALEDLVKRFGVRVSNRKKFRGKVFFSGDEETIYKLNFMARSVNRIIILLGFFEDIKTLDDVERAVKSLDMTNYIGEEQSFAIKPNRIGSHKFTSIDIARVSGKAVIDSYMDSTGKRLRVDLDNPDVIITVELIEKYLLVGIDTTGLSLHIRRYRKYNHPMPIKTTIAYILINLSDWDGKGVFLDPTCGSGTIPIEAAHKLRDVPICLFRGNNEYAFYKLKFLDIEKANSICSSLIDSIRFDLVADIRGIDINVKHVEGAKLNAESAKVIDTVKFSVGDATKLHEILRDEKIDFIVANPPYRLGNRIYLKRFYEKFIISLNRVLSEGGKAVIITSEDKLVENGLKNTDFKRTFMRKIPYGSMIVSIMKFVK